MPGGGFNFTIFRAGCHYKGWCSEVLLTFSAGGQVTVFHRWAKPN